MMSKKIILGLSFLISTLFVVQAASAQLINYERRNKYASKSSAASATTSAIKNTPSWMMVAPKVKNRSERRYDRNRDGSLQPTEVKRFLVDVISFVQDRGRISVNSDILKAYDTDADGIISRYELGNLRRDVQ